MCDVELLPYVVIARSTSDVAISAKDVGPTLDVVISIYEKRFYSKCVIRMQ